MPRINIEDSIYRDDSFLSLVEKTGNRYMAIGMIVTAFSLAQKYWLKYKSIPIKHWPNGLDVLIELGIARMVNEGYSSTLEGASVYVRGSSEQFAWLEKSSLGGRSKGSSKTKNTEGYLKNTQQTPKGTQALPLPLPLPLPHTQTLTRVTEAPAGARPPTKSIPDRGGKSSQAWSSYQSAYVERYGTEPVRNAKINSMLCQLVDRLGPQNAPPVAEFFVNHNGGFYRQRMHSVELLLKDAEKLHAEWKLGKENPEVTRSEVVQNKLANMDNPYAKKS